MSWVRSWTLLSQFLSVFLPTFPNDVGMKTAKVELSCHTNIDLQVGINDTEIRNEV